MSVLRTVALPVLALIFQCQSFGQEMTEQDDLKRFTLVMHEVNTLAFFYL
jgi:hypothetical protein